MEVIITPGVKKYLKKVSKIVQIAVIGKLKRLENDYLSNSKKLSGQKNLYRVRIGDYRIVYRVINKSIYIVLVGHRNEIYQELDRMFR